MLLCTGYCQWKHWYTSTRFRWKQAPSWHPKNKYENQMSQCTFNEHDIISCELMSCKNNIDAILKDVKITMKWRASKGPHLTTYSVWLQPASGRRWACRCHRWAWHTLPQTEAIWTMWRPPCSEVAMSWSARSSLCHPATTHRWLIISPGLTADLINH